MQAPGMCLRGLPLCTSSSACPYTQASTSPNKPGCQHSLHLLVSRTCQRYWLSISSAKSSSMLRVSVSWAWRPGSLLLSVRLKCVSRTIARSWATESRAGPKASCRLRIPCRSTSLTTCWCLSAPNCRRKFLQAARLQQWQCQLAEDESIRHCEPADAHLMVVLAKSEGSTSLHQAVLAVCSSSGMMIASDAALSMIYMASDLRTAGQALDLMASRREARPTRPQPQLTPPWVAQVEAKDIAGGAFSDLQSPYRHRDYCTPA